jgi:hypothetical protein
VYAFFPVRQFLILVDPNCIVSLTEAKLAGVFRLIHDLNRVDPPIVIQLLTPSYLADGSTLDVLSRFRTIISLPKKPDNLPELKVSTSLPRELRNRINADTPESQHYRALLALAIQLQVDGVLTQSSELIDGRYPLYQYHRIRVVPVSEIADLVEICAHGHSVFWSASHEDRVLTHDVYYPWAHWKNARLAKWLNKIGSTISNPNLLESLRSAILNRYPMLLYARDMTLFYNMQSDFCFRRRQVERFTIPLLYHFASFYMLLWGMLDHLTIVGKYSKDIKIPEDKCGIRSKQFWKEFSQFHPELKTFRARTDISNWLRTMADVRHTTAHGNIAYPRRVVTDTPESAKSDDEIKAILKEENAALYLTLSPEMIAGLEPMWIGLWRIKNMKLIAPDMVRLVRGNQTYLRAGCLSIDYDLRVVNAIMDAFIVGLFNRA